VTDASDDTATPSPARAPGGVVGFLRARPWARRTLSALSVVLLLIGVGLLAYPFGTNIYQGRVQARLDRQLASPALEQAYRERRVGTGDSLTRIRIPAIGVDAVVVEGTTASALRAGAGHYPGTPLPCEDGNVAIAGHRTTYGKPFANVDRLKTGDLIVLETPVGSCTYQIERAPYVVDKSDFSPVQPTKARALTLTSCHPKGSAKQRIIVRAVFVRDGATPA
jgi:sortase A